MFPDISPSSSLYPDSNIQSTPMVSNEIFVSPTTDMKCKFIKIS